MSASPLLPPLRDVIRRHGLRARKQLGQNFLLDLNLTNKIARSAGDLEEMCVIEIGPGPGGLTRSLLDAGARRVIAIERDDRCIAALDEISSAYPGRLSILGADALEADYQDLRDGRTCVVANLPYNISTALLVLWLSADPWPPWYEHLTLLFQREVAERICAKPGGKTFGRLSVLAQWRTSVHKVFDIDPRAFTPPPQVTSTLLHFTPREAPFPPCRVEDLERVTAAAFGQRRKMLRSSLKTLTGDPASLLGAAGISGELRAEQLDVDGFCRLASCLEHGRSEQP